MDKQAFKWSPDHYKKAGLKGDGPFGYVDGHLVFGQSHHQLIMAAFLNHGWTWAQLASVPQAWGWFSIQHPYDMYDYTDTQDEWTNQHPKNQTNDGDTKSWPWINIAFSSDAGLQNSSAVKGAINEFQYLYQLPVHQPYEATGVDPTQLGKGLKGVGNINKYLKGGQYEYLADRIKGVPPPPKEWGGWSEDKEHRLNELKVKQDSGQISEEESAEYLTLWIEQQSANEVPANDPTKPKPSNQPAIDSQFNTPAVLSPPEPWGFVPMVNVSVAGLQIGDQFKNSNIASGTVWEKIGEDDGWGNTPLKIVYQTSGLGPDTHTPTNHIFKELYVKKAQSASVWKEGSGTYKFLWGDGIFEISKGFVKDQHHFALMDSIMNKLGHPPERYVGGDYVESPFHPGMGNVQVRWHEGSPVPSPTELGNLMQENLRSQPVTGKIDDTHETPIK